MSATKKWQDLVTDAEKDEWRRERFTRPYEPTDYDKRPPINLARPANDNHPGKHDWPARDEALANKLMQGATSAETTALNLQAGDILYEIAELIASKDTVQHNSIGETPTGYGIDARHKEWASISKIKEYWESGAELGGLAQEWRAKHVDLFELKKPSALTEGVKTLFEAGRIRFDLQGRITHMQTRTGRWMRVIATKTGKARGSKAKADIPTIDEPASEPKRPDNDNDEAAEIDLSRGTIEDIGDVEDDDSCDGHSHPPRLVESDDAVSVGYLHEQSIFDPYATFEAQRQGAEVADGRLETYRRLVGPKPFEALVDAATGLRMDEFCGGKRGDKRASAVGRAYLATALDLIMESRCTEKGPPEPIY